jgi:hypothetical protein
MHDEENDAITAGDLDSVIGLLLLIKDRMDRVSELVQTAVEEIKALVEERG